MTRIGELLSRMDEKFRGIVVDENVIGLADALKKHKIFADTVSLGKKDPEIIKSRELDGKILITNNPKDFRADAKRLNYSIISTKRVNKDPDYLADVIVKAFSTKTLMSMEYRNRPWMLKLRRDSKHVVEWLDVPRKMGQGDDDE